MTDQLLPAEIKIPFDQFQVSALIGWIESNGYRPHLLVHPGHPGVRLPPQCMDKPIEVINASSSAVVKTQWFDDRMEFNARFSGKDFRLVIPYHAIKGVQFAGTDTLAKLPWYDLRVTGKVEGGNAPASPVEVPSDTFYVPEDVKPATDTNVGRGLTAPVILMDPAPEAPAPVSNVRTVDFRAARKPKP